MLKNNMISFLLVLIIIFSSNTFGFSLIKNPADNNSGKYLNLIKEKMPFAKDMSLESIKETADGSLNINMKSDNEMYRTLNVSINNDVITSVDYYADPTSIVLGENEERSVSEGDAIAVGAKLLKNLFDEKFVYISTIKDETYLDDALKKPVIYKLLYKNAISDVPIYNADGYVYIDSESGNVVKLKAKRVNESVSNKEKNILNQDEALELFKEKIDPILVYLKNDNSDFPKYDLYYIPTIDYNFLGISAEDGEMLNYNGDKLNDDIIYIKGNPTVIRKTDKNISYNEALEIANKEVSNFKIDNLKLINSTKIDKYFLTGKTAYAFNMNRTEGNLIANANVAVDEETGKVISENIDVWDYDGLSDTECNLDRVIEYAKSIFGEKSSDMALIKSPAVNNDEKTYLFYRIYNDAVVMDNYLRIKTDKNGKIINVSMNWDDADKPCKVNVDKNTAKNIFLDRKPTLYYIYNAGEVKPIYISGSMDYIVDASTGRKVYIDEFEKAY